MQRNLGKFQIGDVVVFTRQYMQNTAMYTYEPEEANIVENGCKIVDFSPSGAIALLEDPLWPIPCSETPEGHRWVNVGNLKRKGSPEAR